MKMHFVLLFVAVSLFSFSCTKDSNEELTIKESGFAELFYIDNKQVSQDEFPYEDEKFFIGIAPEVNSKGINTAVFRAFSTKESYINWGKERGYRVELSLKVEEELKNFVEENKIIEEYERTGEIPQLYLDFQKKYLNEFMSEHNLVSPKSPQIYRRNCGTGIVKLILPHMYPAFSGTWNNSISSANRLGSFVGTTVYNRSFFRQNRGTFWDFGFNELCFVGGFAPFNDIMSSVINITAGW